MLLLLFIIVGIFEGNAVTEMPAFSGTLDTMGVCRCSMMLPDVTFPVDRMEILELTSTNLTISIQKQIAKIQNYEVTLIGYSERLKNLTRRVEVMEMGGVSYTELEFELLKLEIREMDSMVLKLRTSMNVSNVVVETLFEEIHNISIMVDQLESHDKNNILAVRREIISLRKRLEECGNNKTLPIHLPVDYGSCKHGGIKNISKPSVVQLNYNGFAYKYGSWGKDSYFGVNQDTYWVSPIHPSHYYFGAVRLHSNYDDFLL